MKEIPLRDEMMSQETKEILSRIEKWKNVKLEGDDIKWLLYMKTARAHADKPKALESAERQHLSRIREKIETAIQYLTLTAKLLWEQQQEQVFTAENLRDFVEALLTNFEKGKGIVENERVFHIAFMFANKGINCGSDLVEYPAPYVSTPLQAIYPEKARLLNFVDTVLRIKAQTT